MKLLPLLCGVVGFDHRGGGGGGVFVESLFGVFLRLSIVLFDAVSILLSKFNVLGRVGFSPLVTGVEGSAVLKVLMSGFKFKTKSASGLEAEDGGGLYLQNSCPNNAKELNCCLLFASLIAFGRVSCTGSSSQQFA